MYTKKASLMNDLKETVPTNWEKNTMELVILKIQYIYWQAIRRLENYNTNQLLYFEQKLKSNCWMYLKDF